MKSIQRIKKEKTSSIKRSVAILAVTALLLSACNSKKAALTENSNSTTPDTFKTSDQNQTKILDKDTAKADNEKAKTEAKTKSHEKASEKRKEIVDEALTTLRETKIALKALDEGKSKEALAALEKATGKLEIILARNPELALAPVDVEMKVYDLYGSLDTIKSAKKAIEENLKSGQLQVARNLLNKLVSETVISTINLPLASYPEALKKAAKLIDDGKTDEAKETLQTAINTLVVTDIVIPIPVVKAKKFLKEAEKLAEEKKRTEDQEKHLSDLLTAADTEIQFAEELGYGKKKDFSDFHKEIKEIRAKTSGGKSGAGFFDKIKRFINSMTKDSQQKVDEGKK